jgi:putative methionine-R-sulfoxide reductase with GAF domain
MSESFRKPKLFLNLKSKNYDNIVTNSKDEINDNCMLNNRCPYYKKCIKFKNQILAFISSQEKLKLVNQSLHMAIAEKNKIVKEVKNENYYLKGIIYNLTGIKFSDFSYKSNNFNNIDNNVYMNTTPNLNYKSSKNNGLIKKEASKTSTKFFDKIKNQKSESVAKTRSNIYLNYMKNYQNQPNSPPKDKILKFSFLQKSNNSNNRYILENEENNSIKDQPHKSMRKKSQIKQVQAQGSPLKRKISAYNPNDYYEIINNYTKKQKFQSLTKEINSSYISVDVDLMEILNNNSNLKKLEYLTKNDEHFIKLCKTGTNDLLIKYCDHINLLINDYKEIIKVCTRMKDLIKGSINLIESIVSNDSSKKFIEITCNILKCDRISLFIYDKISDKLILVTAEGLNRAQIKLDKTKGIVGNCFTECKVIRIEDAYLDERFNKDIDKQTNYRTKTILCYPLVDKEGECIGVIEAINKFNSIFTDDDQEVLKILSQQAASIFKSISYNDNNRNFVVTLYSLVDYSIKINFVENIYEFCKLTEDLVLNVFNCLEVAIYFLKDEHLIRYFKNNEYKTYDKNFGIIGKVIKTKEIIGYKSIKNVKEHNSLIDLMSLDGLLTFPIFAKKTKEVCAVIQVPFIGEINKYGKPKEASMTIIKKLGKCMKNWIYKNKNCFNV